MHVFPLLCFFGARDGVGGLFFLYFSLACSFALFYNFIFTCDVLLVIRRNNSLRLVKLAYDDGNSFKLFFCCFFNQSRFTVTLMELMNNTFPESFYFILFHILHRNSDVSQNTPERDRKWNLEKQINLRFHLVMSARRSVRHFLINPI